MCCPLVPPTGGLDEEAIASCLGPAWPSHTSPDAAGSSPHSTALRCEHAMLWQSLSSSATVTEGGPRPCGGWGAGGGEGGGLPSQVSGKLLNGAPWPDTSASPLTISSDHWDNIIAVPRKKILFWHSCSFLIDRKIGGGGTSRPAQRKGGNIFRTTFWPTKKGATMANQLPRKRGSKGSDARPSPPESRGVAGGGALAAGSAGTWQERCGWRRRSASSPQHTAQWSPRTGRMEEGCWAWARKSPLLSPGKKNARSGGVEE